MYFEPHPLMYCMASAHPSAAIAPDTVKMVPSKWDSCTVLQLQ